VYPAAATTVDRVLAHVLVGDGDRRITDERRLPREVLEYAARE
jgi:hypothetical protein